METFLAVQVALLPLQALLYIGLLLERRRIEGLYKKSLMRLVHRNR